MSEEGPAARAGVKVGDKLLEVNICYHFLFLVAPYRTSHSCCFQSAVLVSIWSQVNGVDLHGAEHHTAVEALRNSGAAVVMTVLRERMVEPENAITTTPLRPEDDYFPRERRSSGLPFLLDPASPAVSTGPMQRLATCLVRNDKGLGFSIAGGKGSTPYRVGDTVNTRRSCIYTRDLPCSKYFMVCRCFGVRLCGVVYGSHDMSSVLFVCLTYLTEVYEVRELLSTSRPRLQ